MLVAQRLEVVILAVWALNALHGAAGHSALLRPEDDQGVAFVCIGSARFAEAGHPPPPFALQDEHGNIHALEEISIGRCGRL